VSVKNPKISLRKTYFFFEDKWIFHHNGRSQENVAWIALILLSNFTKDVFTHISVFV
jgi:hypothetical protein